MSTNGRTSGPRGGHDARRAPTIAERTRSRPAFTTMGLALAGAVVAGALVLVATKGPSAPLTVNERVQQIASGLRCVACQNLSVADSPSKMALAMRTEIGHQIRSGKTPDEIRDYFVARYSDWILLSPPASGLALVAWVAPALALALGAVALAWALRRKRPGRPSADAPPTPAERARIRRELAMLEEPD